MIKKWTEKLNLNDDINNYFFMANRGHVYVEVVSYVEKVIIMKALAQAYGNQQLAARILGINRNTLRSKVKKLNIDVGRFKE